MYKQIVRVLLFALLCSTAALPARPATAGAAMQAGEDQAEIHVLHLVADGPAVDVRIDDEVQLEALEPGMFSDFIAVAPGEHSLTMAPLGEEDAIIGPVDLDLEAGHRYTIAAMGPGATGDLSALVIDETAEMEGVDMAANNFRIIINNIAGSPPISIYEEGEFLEKNVAPGDYSALAVAPFSWDTGMAVAGEDLDDVIFPFDLEDDDQAGFWEPYTVYVFGMMGEYPGEPDEDYFFAMPSITVLAPDLAAFLGAFSPFELTGDYKTYMRFESLLAAWESVGMGEELADGGPYTVFAPTDAAFEALAKRKLNKLLADPDALREVLRGHVVAGAMTYEEMLEAGAVETLQGNELAVVASEDDGLTFGLGDNADVLNFPYTLADGTFVYFVRNHVLMPEAMPEAAPQATTEATPEATTEAMPEDTPEPAPEATPEATPTANP